MRLEEDIFAFLCRKYVQRSDDRQKAMGLQYTEAETHDLAHEITLYVESLMIYVVWDTDEGKYREGETP